MSKIKLQLGEILALEAEINGVTNQQTGEVVLKGLLAENINLIIKYRLTKLAESLLADKKTVDDMRNELVKKYGEEDGKGGIQVTPFLDEAKAIQNPKFALFANEYNTLLAEQKEIDFPTITLEDLKDVKGEGFYGIFLKLITEEKEVVEVIE
jgi:DNA polymerase III sliding clamp (beta) subunit (PCNA family)